MRKILCLVVFLLIVVSGCVQSQSPTDIIQSSKTKSDNTNYLIEYDSEVKTFFDDELIENKFRTAIKKLNENRKTEIYVNEVGLIQTIIKNELGLFSCNLLDPENASCVLIQESGGETFVEDGQNENIEDASVLKKMSDLGIISLNSVQKSIQVGSKTRECDNIQFSINPEKITKDNIKQISEILVDTEEEEPLEFKLSGSMCIDKETGLVLESSTDIGYDIYSLLTSMKFRQQISQKATRLDTNPLLSEKEFEIPESRLEIMTG